MDGRKGRRKELGERGRIERKGFNPLRMSCNREEPEERERDM